MTRAATSVLFRALAYAVRNLLWTGDPLVKPVLMLFGVTLALLEILSMQSGSSVLKTSPAPVQECLADAKDWSHLVDAPRCAEGTKAYVRIAAIKVREAQFNDVSFVPHEVFLWLDNLLVDVYTALFIVLAVWGYQRFTGISTMRLRRWRWALWASVMVALLAALADHSENFWTLAKLGTARRAQTFEPVSGGAPKVTPVVPPKKLVTVAPVLTPNAPPGQGYSGSAAIGARPLYTQREGDTVASISIWKWRFIGMSLVGSVLWVTLALAREWRWAWKVLRYRDGAAARRRRFHLAAAEQKHVGTIWREFKSLRTGQSDAFPSFAGSGGHLCHGGIYLLFVRGKLGRSTRENPTFAGEAAFRYACEYFDLRADEAVARREIESYLRWLAWRGWLRAAGTRWEIQK